MTAHLSKPLTYDTGHEDYTPRQLVAIALNYKAECDRFRKEWADRFGFRATKNPRDSFESINEVAEILSRPSIAAIEYALQADEGMAFLRCWMEGDWEAIRNEWTDLPTTVFPTLI